MRWTPQAKQRWWRDQIISGQKTTDHLNRWLNKNQHTLTTSELALLVWLGSEIIEEVARDPKLGGKG